MDKWTIIIVVVILLLVYLTWNWMSNMNYKQTHQPLLISSPVPGNKPLQIGSNKQRIPEAQDGYSLMYWMSIDNPSYSQGQMPQYVLFRGDGKGYRMQPGIFLDPNTNNLIISIQQENDTVIFKQQDLPTDAINSSLFDIHNVSLAQIKQMCLNTPSCIGFEAIYKPNGNDMTTMVAGGRLLTANSTNNYTVQDNNPIRQKVVSGMYKNYSQCVDDSLTWAQANKNRLPGDDDGLNNSRRFLCGLYFNNQTYNSNDTTDDRKEQYKNVGLDNLIGQGYRLTAFNKHQTSSNNPVLLRQNNLDQPQMITIENVPVKQWFHVGLTAKDNTVEVYINGLLTKTTVLPSRIAQNNGHIFIGSEGGFPGQLTQLRVFNHAVSGKQIRSIYLTGPIPSVVANPDQLVSKYLGRFAPLEEGLETVAEDIFNPINNVLYGNSLSQGEEEASGEELPMCN
jgi:hypothetical protein